MYWSTLQTQIGPFTIVANDDAVYASGWTADVNDLVPVIHPALRPESVDEREDLGEITKAADAYHQGDFAAIDEIPVVQQSGEFLMHAWDVLRTVPAGEPITYSKYAEKAGRPDAIRAAASACARNAAALFVPCHRILRSGGALGGFRWGLEIKQWLLDHEAVAVTR